LTGSGLVRAFVALEIPEEIRSQLKAIQSAWRSRLPRARWTRPEGWHLTLKFLGEVDRQMPGALAEDLAPRIRGLGPVSVRLAGTGFYPTAVRPRVAWVGGTAERVDAVVAAVEESAERLGFARERRVWSVHVTQARLKERWPASAVQSFLDDGEMLQFKPFECREVVLFESDLQPGGAVYTALGRLPLE
jgi:2'-5' RNA ligase